MYPSCVRSYKEHCNGCALYVVCDVCKVFIKPCHKASVLLMIDKISQEQISGRGLNEKGWAGKEITSEWLQRWSDVDLLVSQISRDVAEQ